jgi:DNA polymerase-3 subunit delta
MAAQPGVYILQGEDTAAADSLVRGLLKDLGDPTMADMNSARLDGRTHSLDDLVQAISAMPFLAARRVVILRNPLDRIKNPAQQKKLLEILERIPPTTVLAVIVEHLLTEERDAKKGRMHWLERWAKGAGEKVALHTNALPEGPKLVEWIGARVREKGGQISPGAANRLAGLVGPAPHILLGEIEKLLAYVNYSRKIEEDDVLHLTPTIARLEDFALVNALRARNTQQALKVLRLEIEEKDIFMVFQSIVYQFRNLLLVRELASEGASAEEVAGRLKLHPYVARTTLEHARHFTLGELEAIYRSLLGVDAAIKTGEMPADLALDVLVTNLTQ